MKTALPEPRKKPISAEPLRAFSRPIDEQTTAPALRSAPHRAEFQGVSRDLPPHIMTPIVGGESVDPYGHPTPFHVDLLGGVTQQQSGEHRSAGQGIAVSKPIAIRAPGEFHQIPIDPSNPPIGVITGPGKKAFLGVGTGPGKKKAPTHQKPVSPGSHHDEPKKTGPELPGHGNPGGVPIAGKPPTPDNPIPDPSAAQGQLGPQVGYVDATTTTGGSSGGGGLLLILGLGVVAVVAYLYLKHKKKSEAKNA